MYSLRKVLDSDINLIKIWLQQDYVAKWFGDAEDWLVEIKGRNEEFSFIHHFIVQDNQTPIGFVQYYEYNKILSETDEKQPVGTFGIDYMIGNQNFLGKGLGNTLVRLICQQVAGENPEAVYIVADPTIEKEERNVVSIRVLENYGFKFDDKSGLYIKHIN